MLEGLFREFLGGQGVSGLRVLCVIGALGRMSFQVCRLLRFALLGLIGGPVGVGITA